MLKLEKPSSQAPCRISLHEKEKFFSRTLILAFSIAFAIHLSFIAVFKITALKFPWDNTLFPPIEVNAEAAFPQILISSDLDIPNKLLNQLPWPGPSLPEYPDQPTVSTIQPLEYIKENSLAANVFSTIENEIYQPEYSPFVSPLPPLQIIVSGSLAEAKLLSTIPEIVPLMTGRQTTFQERLSYSVVVEVSSGRIFWVEAKQPVSFALEKFAEGILKNMLFSSNPTGSVISGEIELHFNMGRS